MQRLSLARSCPHPARSPSSPFGKGSKAQKAGTRDAESIDPAAGIVGGRPFSSRPGSSGSRVYRHFRRKRKAFADDAQTARLRPESTHCSSSASLTARSTPLADLAGAVGVGAGACPQLVELPEPVSEGRVQPRPREIVIRDEGRVAHVGFSRAAV